MTFEPIVGRYLNLKVADADYRIYVEEAGKGYRCFVCTRRARIAVSTAT
jgi:hypothetical protein